VTAVSWVVAFTMTVGVVGVTATVATVSTMVAVVVSEEHPTYASESVAINAIIAEMEGRRIETSVLARSAARLAWPINWVVAS